jgi:hypothetical protein
MTKALSLTGADLIRALGDAAALISVERAVQSRAEALARDVEGGDVTARVSRRGPADYTVTVSGPGLSAREFGSRARDAEPVIGPAVGRLAGKG